MLDSGANLTNDGKATCSNPLFSIEEKRKSSVKEAGKHVEEVKAVACLTCCDVTEKPKKSNKDKVTIEDESYDGEDEA